MRGKHSNNLPLHYQPSFKERVSAWQVGRENYKMSYNTCMYTYVCSDTASGQEGSIHLFGGENNGRAAGIEEEAEEKKKGAISRPAILMQGVVHGHFRQVPNAGCRKTLQRVSVCREQKDAQTYRAAGEARRPLEV